MARCWGIFTISVRRDRSICGVVHSRCTGLKMQQNISRNSRFVFNGNEIESLAVGSYGCRFSWVLVIYLCHHVFLCKARRIFAIQGDLDVRRRTSSHSFVTSVKYACITPL